MNKNSLSLMLVRIKEKDMLNDPNIKFERTGTFHQLKVQIKNIFHDALVNIKPIPTELYHNNVFNLRTWSGYNSFNYKKYFKAASLLFKLRL